MLRARERDIAFVFQLFALYPHMNVRKNIGFPLLAQGMPKAEIKQRVEETAKLLRIDHLLDRPVSGLAGGDRQRVALGRAIVRRPKCFLMDEPLGTLDAEFRDLMVHELRELHNRIHATTVYVTHDQLEAMSMADKIAVMNHGVIEQFGTPQEIYDRPASMFVADFIGSPPMNFLKFDGGLQKGAKEIVVAGRRRRRAGDPRGFRAGRLRARRPAGAHPLRRCLEAARLDLRHRISRHHADRRGRDGGRHGQGARSRRHPAARPASRSGSRSTPRACRCSRRRRAGRSARAPETARRRSGAWLTFRCAASSKRFGDTQAVDDLDAHHRGRRVRRAARPDRRRQDDDAAPRRRAGAAGQRLDRRSTGATSRRSSRPRATSPSCSSNIRSIRI